MPDLDEVANWEQGQQHDSFPNNIIQAARDSYCALYRADPLGSTSGYDPTGVGSFVRGLNDTLCRKIPPLPGQDDPQEFAGGQCPIDYLVSLDWAGIQLNAGVPEPVNGVDEGVLQGPILKIVVRQTESAGGRQSNIWYDKGAGLQQTFIGTDILQKVTSARVAGIAPLSGGADNCGNPPPIAPPPPPNPSPPVNFVPIPFRGPGSLPIPVPVFIRPNFTLAPEINIQVGPFNVNFDFNGVDIQPNFNFPDPIPDPPPYPTPPTGVPVPPRLPPGGAGGGGKAVECPDPCPEVNLAPVISRLETILDRIDDLEDLLEAVKACACKKEQDVVITTLGAGDSGVFALPKDTIAVEVVVTQVGPRVKDQWGGTAAPDVIFVGWHSFGRDLKPGLRNPLSHSTNVLLAPPNATSFTFTVTQASQAVARALHLVDKP